jgi:hypothetical protein
MTAIVDFHTHAFPDELADRAMKMLEEEGDIRAHLDGRISSLLRSMDENGIEKSVVCSIATKPSQFDTIMNWSRKIMTDRIIPLPSIHPDDPLAVERVLRIRGEGFKGIKFHPYYQDFDLDDERLFPIYESICRERLIMVVHTGFDLAFEKIRRADPARIIRVLDRFPDIRMVTTHLGAWDDWEEVERHLSGKRIYMEISFSLEYLSREAARRIILNHPGDHILFGSDSPWTDQGNTLALLRGLELGEERERLVLRENAAGLLASV